ncbi:MAG: DUF86 domain-containing protein [Chamaesiphon sp.]
MPSRNWQLRIQDIINAAKGIQRYTAGMSFEEFQQNEMLIKAVLYEFVVIGEAAINIPPQVQLRYSQIPWQLMGDMRNVIAHEYFQVSLRIIWNTTQNNLPTLVIQIEEMWQRETEI